MATDVLDPYKSNAYSGNVRFDITHKQHMKNGATNVISSDEVYNPEISMKKSPPKTWELDVRALISSKKWLQNYGLKRNRLTYHTILPTIGFKQRDDFDSTLKRPISARYSDGLFTKVVRQDGKVFNVTCTKDKLRQIENRLIQAIQLYKRRMDWLTTESRRIFGVIEEKAVTIVMDIKNMSPQQFDHYRVAMERVIREQVSQLAKFNMIRAAEDIQMYQPDVAPVTHDTIEGAINWMWNLDRLAAVSKTASCEAVLRAVEERNIESVYLFTEGSSIDSSRELLKEKILSSSKKLPIHVVSYNSTSSDTVQFLKLLSSSTGGKFHAYAVIMEMDAYESLPVDPHTNRANIVLKKKTYGGVPPGAGIRDDVMLIFEELEEARSTLVQIQTLVDEVPEPSIPIEPKDDIPEQPEKSEQYMSSKEWLQKYGLDSRKLGLFDLLSGVAFKHQDGVVEVKEAPPDETTTDAVGRQKLVNARYCDKFPVVRWRDGRVVHVHVTPEIHRIYEERMQVALNTLQQRVDWLNQGSRALFGTVIEDMIYIAIDTSSSMLPSIQFVKDKLFILMQEQLRHKMKFNLIAFNSKSMTWRDHLVDVNERNLQNAWAWVQNLTCWGSTNTYSAIQTAISDPLTQAIYLLTDGRPDQPPKSIIAQVQMTNRVPIHTISFNCNDTEANRFLFDLSRATGGRYHYFSENGVDPEQPEAWESEDVNALKQEMKLGLENLDKIAELRDECASLAWKKAVDELRQCSREHSMSTVDKNLTSSSMDMKEMQRALTPRPSSAPPRDLGYVPTPPPRPASSLGFRSTGNLTARRSITSPRHHQAQKGPQKPLVAGHTRTSLLRTLNSSGNFSANEWLLPETRQLFDNQADRQKKLSEANRFSHKRKSKQKRKPFIPGPMSSKMWLNKHGLVAKKLTILDALAPTFVSHKAKYVPILDKFVLAKVFDEILPLAHTSGRDKKTIKLVNPNGVDLKAYEGKVQKAINSYTKRLNSIVWQYLSESAKQEFESEDPVDFAENRQKILDALDEAGWPIKEQDIYLLEEEIKRGNKFIQQSKDLRKAANEKADDDLGVYEDHASIVSGLTTSRDYEGLGKVIEENTPREETALPTTVRKVRRVLDTLRGQTVIARDNTDGLYYPGFVIRCTDSRHAMVEFDDKTRLRVPTRFLLPTGGAVACPLLRIGDQVFVRVVNTVDDKECYVPGVVQNTPRRSHDALKFYTILMYNGQKAITMRNYLIKISKSRYMFAKRYILDLQYKQTDSGVQSGGSPDEKEDNRWEKQERRSRKRYKNERSKKASDSEEIREKSHHLRSESRSRSRSQTPSGRSRSITPDRSRSRSRSESRSRSQTESRSRSRSRSISRSTSREKYHDDDRMADTNKVMEEKEQRLQELQQRLEQQQKDQEREQKKLRREAKKIAKMQKQLSKEKSSTSENEELGNANLLKQILATQTTDSNQITKEVEDQVRNMNAGESLPLIQMRRSLPALREGEEVLARWSDEGWYYRGTIHQDCADYGYMVQDSIGYLTKIWREDIITDSDDANHIIQIKDAVIALHPSYSYSYTPGVVLEVHPDMWMQVRFYDGEEARLPREEVYYLSPDKFEHDVAYIRQCETQWIGQAVVARNDQHRLYMLATVLESTGSGRKYVLEWGDHTQTVQDSVHIFGVYTRNQDLAPGERVLAVYDTVKRHYLPGWISGTMGSKLVIKFSNGQTSTQVNPVDCFWLSKAYYDCAISFLKTDP